MGVSTVSVSRRRIVRRSVRARQYNPAVIEEPTEPAFTPVDDISQLLRAWSDGDQLALDELTPIVKRGRGVQHVSLDEAVLVGVDPGVDLVALDDALNALARVDPRKVRVVDMQFFGGLSVEETAMVLKVSPVTVRRDWSSAKIWLYRELTGETDDGLGSLETAR